MLLIRKVTVPSGNVGTFSANSPNLVIVAGGAEAGTIDLSASSPGVYDITHTTLGSCSTNSTISITITAPAVSALSYAAAAFCIGTGSQSPVDPLVPNGTFTSDDGALIVDPTSGAIDVDVSTVGNYIITYTPNDACTNPSTFNVEIQATPIADAGGNGTSCTLSYQLNGNSPVTGTGTWTPIAPPGGVTISFDDPASPTATVTVDVVGTYQFQWEVTNGVCAPANDAVEISFTDPLIVTHSDVNVYDDADCSGLGFGSYEVSVSGGSGDYNYLWTGNDWDGNPINETDPHLNGPDSGPLAGLGVAGGIYTLTVTDNDTGCDTTIVAVIGNLDLTSEGATPNVEVTTTASCDGGNTGDIEVAIPTSGSTYQVRFYDSLGAAQYVSAPFVGNVAPTRYSNSGSGLAAGTYYIEVADLTSNEACRTGDTRGSSFCTRTNNHGR